MVLGINNKNGEKYCAVCGKLVKSDKENYCFHCGNPLQDDAVLLRVEELKTLKLELINQLVDEINDNKALSVLQKKGKRN